MGFERILTEALHLPPAALAYSVGERLTRFFPDRTIVEGVDEHFDIERFAREGQCRLTRRTDLHSPAVHSWDDGELVSRTPNGAFTVDWGTERLDIVVAEWSVQYAVHRHFWVAARSEAVGHAFVAALCAWNSEVRGEVLVFSGGCWSRDPELFRDIQGATLSNLVLAGDLAERIEADLSQFFAAREMYDRYGVPWKRGILFLGPPGNGKTHAVKALINRMQRPCLYVKSFSERFGSDHENIQTVFRRARSSPCLLVLEDLDALLNDGNRSYFLNELDGFAANTGIVTLATTNHPERLDPAIVDRPSRFDRKYHFQLPGPAERATYLRGWNSRLAEEMRFPEEMVAELVDSTNGFSYAYLKELMLSAMVDWMSGARSIPIATILRHLVLHLVEQMSSMNESSSE